MVHEMTKKYQVNQIKNILKSVTMRVWESIIFKLFVIKNPVKQPHDIFQGFPARTEGGDGDEWHGRHDGSGREEGKGKTENERINKNKK